MKSCTALGVGVSVSSLPIFGKDNHTVLEGKRVGIIGLDTSHSIAFTKALNSHEPDPKLKNYRVTAAYPYGSSTIESSKNRIPGYIEEVRGLGVAIVDSIDELLEQVDVVLLETNDGTMHLQQALPVLQAGKRMFIDKPIAASLEATKSIFRASKELGVPTFSTSSLRYTENIADLRSGKLIGEITGVDSFSPAVLESSHPDLFWYGIHGIEILYSILGVGCEFVQRIFTDDTDVVVGVWSDGRVGKFRGIRKGKNGYGGMAFGENGQVSVGKYTGYIPLLYEIVNFFETGIVPVQPEETIELVAFMEAADESKRLGGTPVNIQEWLRRGE